MSTTPQSCRDEHRRALVRARRDPDHHHVLNGIDYIDVGDDRRTLTVHLLHEVPKGLTSANVRIDGGRRITGVKVLPFKLPVRPHGAKPVTQFTIKVDREGDFSPYTLRLVEPDAHGRPAETPLAGFDPVYARVEFSFKVDCPTGLDCGLPIPCVPDAPDEPAIDYLTKDYAGFRQLIFDRLSLIMPGWSEQHAADLGVALVELLAYVGDDLSYLQDAVATEAYLGTARQRISVRRHVRLVDYSMHEGCNARAWVCLKAAEGLEKRSVDLAGVQFLAGSASPGSASGTVFEALSPRSIDLYTAHNEIKFYTWGNRECCLPRGATSATLWAGPKPAAGQQPAGVGKARTTVEGHPAHADQQKTAKAGQPAHGHAEPEPHPPSAGYGKPEPPPPPPPPDNPPLFLQPGDVLIFEEVLGPDTGKAADADAHHRQAVRLTAVTPVIDPLGNVRVYEVEWAQEDKLLFTLCISALGDPPQCAERTDVSVARGNVVLVDQGGTVNAQFVVPDSPATRSQCVATGHPRDIPQLVPPFRPPPLGQYPVTQSVPFPVKGAVARQQARQLAGLMDQVRAVLPGLLQQVKQSQQPLATADLMRLAVIFGWKELAEVRLIHWETGEPCVLSAREQIRALNRLLARADRVLAKKAHRVCVLTGSARTGYILTADEVAEIGAMFGADFATGFQPDDPRWFGAAQAALLQDPRAALPAIILIATVPDTLPGSPGEVWTPSPDLLSSQADDRRFVAEIDDDGRAFLRFGDGNLGEAPAPGTTFAVTYRVGNGTAGNVPAETITQVKGLPDPTVIAAVRNSLPAVGGIDPEPVAEVKLYAPGAFRAAKRRAVTADDYAELAGLYPGVQRAAASIRWTGGLREVRVAIDPLGTEDPSPVLIEAIQANLEQYRRIDHDLRIVAASYVALDVALSVDVQPNYLRGHVEAALLRVFSNTVNPDGSRGMFHPDNLTFGQDIELSRLIAAAQPVAGVQSVTVTRLRRLGDPPPAPNPLDPAVTGGILSLGALEIPRLDNDPSFPEHGMFTLTLRGGR